MLKYKILGLVANHTNNNIKYNISLNNISLIKKHLTNITIIDSKNEYYAEKLKDDFINDDKINNYLFTNNDNYYDFGKWIFYLEKINLFNQKEGMHTS